MSGICGFYNSDGQPSDHNLLERMTRAIAHRGQDRVAHWVHKTVAFGHCMLQTTPESLYESQPLTDESAGMCLTLDGRVDNRKELIDSLESEGARLRDDTDAELVLKAYERWGPECPLLIIGDFSFAIWDSTRRQLFCARDVSGNRPFVYHWNGRRLIFASELHALFEDPATPREVNEGMVAEYLAARITDKEETLYKHLLRLPPAHWLMVKAGQITKRRYWNPDSVREIRYRTNEEYAEHFKQVFKESVRCCLRSYGPVGAYLSGGLDSSSVVSMTQMIYEEGGYCCDRLFETFSMVYPGLLCDESRYIRAMVERWNLRANCLLPEVPSFELLKKQSSFYKDICDYPNGTQADPIRSLAHTKGFRVLLTGDLGDERLGGSLYYLADFVRRPNPIGLWREMKKQSISPLSAHGLSALRHFALAPILPDPLRRIMRLAKRMLVCEKRSLEWIENGFAQRTELEQRLKAAHLGQPVRSFKAWLRMQLEDGGQVHGTEMEDRASARFGMEQRHPFTDRRMIELSFGLPENQRLQKVQKFVLRNAMRGLLPDSICDRQDKAEFSESLFRAVRRASTLGIRKRSEELGWIRGDQVRTMQKEVEQLHDAGDRAYIVRVWPLWMILALDLWVDNAVLDLSTADLGHAKFATA